MTATTHRVWGGTGDPLLEVRVGTQRWAVHPGPEFVIGRGSDADAKIDDAEVSRRHVVIRHTLDGWLLEDVSSNGTYCDGTRVNRMIIDFRRSITLGLGGPTVELLPLKSAASSPEAAPISARPQYPPPEAGVVLPAEGSIEHPARNISAAVPSDTPDEQGIRNSYCGQCGAPAVGGSSFCGQCGSALAATVTSGAESPAPTPPGGSSRPPDVPHRLPVSSQGPGADIQRQSYAEPAVAASNVPAVASGLAMKRRNPAAVWLGLPLVTLGIYHYVWYYKIHKEMAEYDRRRSIPIAGPTLVLLFLWWTLIAPLISYHNTGVRIRNAQRSAGLAPSCSPTLAWLLLFAIGLNSLYLQAELNKVVDQYAGTATGTPVPLFV